MPQRDDIDHLLVGALQDHPRLTNRALAAQVGVSAATVAARLDRLRAEHCLALTVLCDWVQAGYSTAAALFIRTHDDPRDVGRRLAAQPRVHTVNVLLGAYDLLVLVLEGDLAKTASVIDELRGVEGAEVVEIDVVYDVVKMTLGLAPLPIAPWDPDELHRASVALDSLDHQIVAALAADGHQSNREVARRLGINETTVRSRVARLETSGLLRLVAVADPLNMGLAGATAMLTVRFSDETRPQAVAQLVRQSGVAAYLACLGNSDAIIVVTAATDDALLDVIAEVRTATAAADIAAFTVVQTLKHRAHLTRFTTTESVSEGG